MTEGPKGWTLLRYRLGGHIPQGYEAWARADISSRWFPLRDLLRFVMGIPFAAGILALLGLGWSEIWPSMLGTTLGATLATMTFRRFRRERVIAHYEKKWLRERVS